MSSIMTDGTFPSAQDPNSSYPDPDDETTAQVKLLSMLNQAIALAPQAGLPAMGTALEIRANRIREKLGIPEVNIPVLETVVVDLEELAEGIGLYAKIYAQSAQEFRTEWNRQPNFD